ncbi:MAG: hypothetical protein AAB582_01505 [Patescibacteria group bacterium]
MIIGLSLSTCIWDVFENNIDPDSIEKIIARTACRTPEEWERVILDYRRRDWWEFPEKAEELARKLLAEGKIEQPRLDPINPRMPIMGRKRIWVKSGRRIRYVPSGRTY